MNTEPMRAFTLKRPWPAAVMYGTPEMGHKLIENRSWELPAKYAGTRVLLHAGNDFDVMARYTIRNRAAMEDWPNDPKMIVAAVTFTGCHWGDGCCSPWGSLKVFHWEISEDITILPEPVPCPGRLGFWTPPARVQEAVAAQLARAT